MLQSFRCVRGVVVRVGLGPACDHDRFEVRHADEIRDDQGIIIVRAGRQMRKFGGRAFGRAIGTPLRSTHASAKLTVVRREV